jgi:dienelactone hydrolase/peptidoglycan hydrolase-like protein with peptidoglycan-binding domain
MWMRFAYLIVLAALMLPAFVSAQSIVCAPLSKGSTGPRVVALQAFLDEAYLEFPTPTGYFGSITETAVKQWQREKGIVSSGNAATTGWGVVGPKTMAAMGLSCANSLSSSESPTGLPSSIGNPNATAATDATASSTLVKSLTAQIALLLKQIADLKAATPSPTVTSTNNNDVPVTETYITATHTAPCSWNGTMINNGARVSAYQTAVVPSGSQCISETRICSHGTLSGSYTSPSCGSNTGGAPLTCSFAGGTISSGFSILAYQSPLVATGNSCASETRSCSNGVLSGSYQYHTCTIANPTSVSSAICNFNGTDISSGGSTMAYQSASVPSGNTCVSESRTCTSGMLSGSFQYSSCSVAAGTSCTFNGATVPNGTAVTAYQNAAVAFGGTCIPESRTCANGVLSGSFQNSSCSVATASSCTFNNQTIAHGGSVAAFQNTVSNSSCASQTRTCTNGALSGNSAYAYDNCTVSSNNAPLPNTFVPATHNGKNIQLHAWYATPGGSGPYPAIILAHGCSGLNPDDNGADWAHTNTWAQIFRSSGYATLVVDSFTARGYSGGICNNSDLVSPMDRSPDLYSAATVLAKMGTINPQKIGLFGTSHGANAVSWPIRNNQSATQVAHTALSAVGGKISASAGLYPACDTALSSNSLYSPYFVAIGSADSSANPSTCKSLTNFPTVSGTPVDLNNFGSLVRIIVYPNVGHRFDVPNSGEYNSSATTDVQAKIKTFFDSYLR